MKKRNNRGRPRSVKGHLLKLREKNKVPFSLALEKLEIKRATLYQLESDVRKPSIETARKMCELYKCSLDDIFLVEKKVI